MLLIHGPQIRTLEFHIPNFGFINQGRKEDKKGGWNSNIFKELYKIENIVFNW